MNAFAQIAPDIPDIPWSALSPELVLFSAGILVLLLDTAGAQRLQASFLAAGALVAGGVFAWTQTEHTTLPALVALAGAGQFALTTLWRDRPRMLGALLAALGFAAALGVTIWQWAIYAGRLTTVAGASLVGTESLLSDMVAVDGVALFTRFTICIAGFLTVLLGYQYAEERRIHRGEYYPLLLFAATGMTLVASAADLIMVFIGVEILSLSLYILAAFAKRDLVSQEAGIKYFLLSSFASAILLFGIALSYGLAGTTNISAVGSAMAAVDAPTGLVLAGMALLLVGFSFKVAIVPFHMWTPDVYQGAPTPVTGFMSAGTKAAAFAAFLRVFVGALGPLQWSWLPVLWVLAVVTMIAGAVLAVVQTDVKRMLAYSTVAHVGYVLIGLIAVTREGVSSTLLYLLIYAVMSLGAFGVVALFERMRHKAPSLDDLRGLGRRYPIPAGMFALFLLSLAGIPGTAGFIAKLAVFRAGVIAGHTDLVVVGVVSSLVAAFFYVRVIYAMFMDEPEVVEGAVLPDLVTTSGSSAGLAVAAAAVVVLGVLPGALIDLAAQAATFAG